MNVLKVWKYPIPQQDYFTLDLPEDATILCAQAQGNSPMIWALVDPEAPKKPRRFRLAGTGHEIKMSENVYLWYIGTFQIYGGQLVFHLFEVKGAHHAL